MTTSTILIGIGISAVFLLIIGYNRGITLRNYTNEAFSTTDVYLKKRWDLVPNLLTVVKSYAAHETNLFEEIAKIRTADYSEMTPEEKMKSSEEIVFGINKIIAAIENYPEIKADKHFKELMSDLNSIETEIANSRKYYNGCIRIYNNYCEIFPSNIAANIFGFKPKKMFESTDSEKENIKILF